MAEKTKIAWADMTWSPWIGCTKVASGCTNCYAEADFAIRRNRVVWGPGGSRVKTSEGYWKKPLAWDKRSGKCPECFGAAILWGGRTSYDCEHCCATGDGERFRVFPSLCDVFDDTELPVVDNNGRELWMSEDERGRYCPMPDDLTRLTDLERANIKDGWFRKAFLADLRHDMFKLIDATPNLDWVLLTKRPENILRMWPTVEGRPYVAEAGAMNDYQLNRRENVWLIFSASDQPSLEAGLPHLLACNDFVPVIGLSLEPLLGPIDLSGVMDPAGVDYVENIPACQTGGSPLDWIIIGGESGPNARPCALEWIDDIRRQCAQSGVPCFVKQMGSNPVTENANIWNFVYPGKRIGSAWGHGAAGCHINLDDSKGGDPREWPEGLRVQEYPNAIR